MKNKIVKGVLLTFMMLFITACCNNNEGKITEADKEQIKSEIQAKEALFAEIYNAGEMKSIGYYADDAISYSQNRPPLVGKEAIVEYLADGIDSLAVHNKISFTTVDVFPSKDGGQVVEIGHYEVVDANNTVVNSGNYMSLFEKRNGKYVSVRDMSVSDMPWE